MKILPLFLILFLIGCAESNNTVSNNPNFINLTNINLDEIDVGKRSQLIKELNEVACLCPDCSIGISVALCLSTNNVCQYSQNILNKKIKDYKLEYRSLSDLNYSIWDAARVGDIDGIYQHLIRENSINQVNVNQETALDITLKKGFINASVFIMMSEKGDHNQHNKNNFLLKTAPIINLKYVENFRIFYKYELYQAIKNIANKLNWNQNELIVKSIDFIKSPTPIIPNNNILDAKIQIVTTYLLVETHCEDIQYNIYIDLNKKSEFMVLIPKENKTIFQGYPLESQ